MGKIIDHNNFWYIEKNPISKTGVFPYLGREIGYPGLEPNKIYYVLRSEQELMSPEAIKSFELLPITKGHRMLGPQEQGLTPAEKIPQQGVVGEKVFAEGDTLYANIKVTSEQAKNDINNGLKELSLGYFCRWVKEAGEYKGRHYDFAQKNIRGNHLAIVPLGRMGHDVRVMDALPAGAGSYALDSLELSGPFVSALLPAGHIPLKLFSLPGQAQDWQESDHPRKKDGKFAPKGQGESGKGNELEAAETKAETPEQTQNASETQNKEEELDYLERSKNNFPFIIDDKNKTLDFNTDYIPYYRNNDDRIESILDTYDEKADTPHWGRGYSGYSTSNNALLARKKGLYPKSEWDKKRFLKNLNYITCFFGIPVDDNFFQNLPSKDISDFLEKRGYHHTSKYYNKTPFYRIDLKKVLEHLDNTKPLKGPDDVELSQMFFKRDWHNFLKNEKNSNPSKTTGEIKYDYFQKNKDKYIKSEKQQTKEEKYNSPAVLKNKEEVLSKAVELTEGKAPVADIKNNEFDGADVPAKRQAAKRYYIDNLKGHAFKNKNSGQKIIIGDEGKTFSQTGYESKINSFKYLPDILERSEYLGKDEDINGRKDIKAFHYYGGQVNTPDGKQLLIMSVRELKDGDFYYNHHITKKQSSKSTPVLPSGTKTTAKDSIAKEEQQIKGDLKMDKKLSEMSITEMLESVEDGMNLFIEEAGHAGDDWDESKHKRDADGKFTSGGGAINKGITSWQTRIDKAGNKTEFKNVEYKGYTAEIRKNGKVVEYTTNFKPDGYNGGFYKGNASNAEVAEKVIKAMIERKLGNKKEAEKLEKEALERNQKSNLESTKTNGTDGISAAPEDKENTKMDKRKVIEEIMAIAAKPADEFKDGKEEQIRTIAGLAEKLAYNKSERGANGEDAAKDKDKAKDEGNPSKTDKEADKAEDAMESRIAANFAKKAALYEKVSPFTGSFDHNPMTLSQMAKYACDKLGIKGVAEDGAQTALEGYLVGAQKQAVVRQAKGATMDAAPESDAAFENYLKEAE